MPLPHRPITAPGAQSTLNFTRVPVDARVARERSAVSQEREGGSLETGSEAVGPAGRVANPEPPGAVSTVEASSNSAPAPAKELVPDVPLDEYVERFHYEPPKDPAEITMHGDAHLPEPVQDPPSRTANLAVKSDDSVVVSATPAGTKPPLAAPVVAAEDVDSRLGLEPETPTEARIARPRFLDINEPPKETKNDRPKETKAIGKGAPTIGGPSFLGLDDVPQTWAKAVGVQEGDYAPRNYHWRAWFAVLVVLVIVALGLLEWRSQVNQTHNGPVEVIRAKLRDWRQVAMSQIGNELASTGNDSAKPGPSDAAKPPAMAQPKAATDNSGQQAAAEKPQVKRQSDMSAEQDVATKQIVPGADELAKAKKASDSAAAAVWLWKATAKGNPDAPVQLADMYIRGEGVPRSCEQAMVLLKTAAEKENAHARNRLALMYTDGTCVPRNRVQAYRWLSSSLTANPNSQWAQQNRDLIWNQMSPDERAAAQKYR